MLRWARSIFGVFVTQTIVLPTSWPLIRSTNGPGLPGSAVSETKDTCRFSTFPRRDWLQAQADRVRISSTISSLKQPVSVTMLICFHRYKGKSHRIGRIVTRTKCIYTDISYLKRFFGCEYVFSVGSMVLSMACQVSSLAKALSWFFFLINGPGFLCDRCVRGSEAALQLFISSPGLGKPVEIFRRLFRIHQDCCCFRFYQITISAAPAERAKLNPIAMPF